MQACNSHYVSKTWMLGFRRRTGATTRSSMLEPPTAGMVVTVLCWHVSQLSGKASKATPPLISIRRCPAGQAQNRLQRAGAQHYVWRLLMFLCMHAGIACPHGRLAPEARSGAAKRFAVSRDTWALLTKLWPQQILWDVQARLDKAKRAAVKRTAAGGVDAAAVAEASKGKQGRRMAAAVS